MENVTTGQLLRLRAVEQWIPACNKDLTRFGWACLHTLICNPFTWSPKLPYGGLTGRYFQHSKSQSLAPVSASCVFFKAQNCLSKISMILLKIRVYHSFGALCQSISLFTLSSSLAFSVAWQSLAARSPCCALSAIAIAAHRPSNLCWSCLFFWYECPVEAYFWFSSTCNPYHLCVHSKLVFVIKQCYL